MQHLFVIDGTLIAATYCMFLSSAYMAFPACAENYATTKNSDGVV